MLRTTLVSDLCLLALVGDGLSAILPMSLDCTHSAHTVGVQKTGGEGFKCPEYFAFRTCCGGDDIMAIEDKLTSIVEYANQMLGEDASQETLEQSISMLADGRCIDYHRDLFASRSVHYRQAYEAAKKGLGILHGAAMHITCAACFVSSMPGKLMQIDDFTNRALRSLQDRMGAIFHEQLVADVPPEGCALHYISSLWEGVSFPSWARFHPEMMLDDRLNVTVAKWMDRILAMLIELPGSLLFQQSLLQLAFFYLDRPESDAFALLHGPSYDGNKPVDSSGGYEQSGAHTAFFAPSLCPQAALRVLILVPKHVGVADFKRAFHAFGEIARDWEVKWLVTAPSHVEAVHAKEGKEKLIWRRFQVGNLDHAASAICAEGHTWIGNFSETDDLERAARVLQRLGTAPQVDDIRQSNFPVGFRPVRTFMEPMAWPPDTMQAYIQKHNDFRKELAAGREPKGTRILVYTCTTITLCGGHGDRLNGMLSAMVVALLSDRLFFIDSVRPVPLSLVLRPRELDWRLFGTPAALPVAFNWNDNLAGFEHDPFHVLDHQADVIRFVSNQHLTPSALRAVPQRAAALGLSPRPALHAKLFHTLFEPSPALQHKLSARSLPQGRLIGIHFRAGDQMPQHWRDPPRHSLEEIESFIACAEEVEASLNWEAHFILFADTDRVLDSPRVAALRQNGKLVWPARTDGLVHLDRSPATLSVRGLLSVWADWWTLAFDVHALVICHSGFGATALEIGPQRPAFLGKGCVPAEGSTS